MMSRHLFLEELYPPFGFAVEFMARARSICRHLASMWRDGSSLDEYGERKDVYDEEWEKNEYLEDELVGDRTL